MNTNSYLTQRKTQGLQSAAHNDISAGKGLTLNDNRIHSMVQRKANTTGLPDNLKSGIENLSGHSMDDVKVHYNSSQPAQFNAHAYAQGTNIHIASGQEKHLAHEAWHVVQQKQGRVKPTMQMKGKVNVNDDAGLEKEADVMGSKAFQFVSNAGQNSGILNKRNDNLTQAYKTSSLIPGQNVLVQRVRLLGQYEFTSNYHFAVKNTGQARTLYSDKHIAVTPKDFFTENGAVRIDTDTGKPSSGGTSFTKIEPKAELYDRIPNKKYPDYAGPQDCVRYAAGLVNNAKNWGERYPDLTSFVRVPGPNAAFDYSGANTTLSDPAENAVAGEMMYTTRLGYALGGVVPPGVFNFHGTSVIAVDGSEQITSEACVGSGRKKPNFLIYGNALPVVGAGQVAKPTFANKYRNVIETPGALVPDQVTARVV